MNAQGNKIAILLKKMILTMNPMIKLNPLQMKLLLKLSEEPKCSI